MANYWLTQYALNAIGWIYLGIVGFGLAIALLAPDTRAGKAVGVVIVLGLASIPVVHTYNASERARVAQAEYMIRRGKAEALFAAHCKNAGEKIYRTVDGVRGVFLMTERKRSETTSQFDPNDPAGDAASGKGYVETFFEGHSELLGAEFVLMWHNRKNAYEFVEVASPDGEGVIQYTDERIGGDKKALGSMTLHVDQRAYREARYGIETSDISSSQDRLFWIAGSRIRIIDLATKEIVAERIGYMMDLGQGSNAAGRQPWAFATYTACPAFPRAKGHYPNAWGLVRNFAEKVVHPVGYSP